ncbi:MAG: Fur family transcriptional regulator [Blastocatellales bacterium]
MKEKVEMMVESYGLKMTPQRRAIVEFLQASGEHPTADEILTAVNEKFPMTSRATVYNTLNWLKGAGMIREVFEGGLVRYDPNTSSHHHFVCRECGKVEDIECEAISALKICSLPGDPKIENYQITVRGLCGQCLLK